MAKRTVGEVAKPAPARRRSWFAGTGLKLLNGWRKAVVAAVIAACVGLPAWLLGGLPTFQETSRYIRSVSAEAAPDTFFTVLLADLAGDDGKKTETVRLARALAANGGLEVVMLGRGLEAATVGSLRDADRAVGEEARGWLERRNADVLVWGQVFEKNLLLGFVPRAGTIGRPNGYSRIGEQIELPRDVKDALEAQVQAVVFSLVAPATAERGEFLARQLKPVVLKLRNLMAEPGAFSPELRTSIAFSFGLAAYTLGEQTADSKLLEEAVVAYRYALRGRPREIYSYAWAWINVNMGAALDRLGRLGEPAHLEGAVSAFRSALEVHTRDRLPLEWAAAQSNLGATLATLGETAADTVLLQQAVTAHRGALEEYSRLGGTADEVRTRDNLGIALASLGQLQSNTVLLDEAIENFRITLAARSRDRAPLDWAATQLNLGRALSILGSGVKDATLLEEAVAAHRSALEEYTRERMPADWSVAVNGMGMALHSLGRLREDPDLLQQAISAYQSSLSVRTRERNVYNWAATQHNLGLALAERGKLIGSSTLFREAIDAYRNAAEGYSEAGASARVRLAEQNIEVARASAGVVD